MTLRDELMGRIKPSFLFPPVYKKSVMIIVEYNNNRYILNLTELKLKYILPQNVFKKRLHVIMLRIECNTYNI